MLDRLRFKRVLSGVAIALSLAACTTSATQAPTAEACPELPGDADLTALESQPGMKIRRWHQGNCDYIVVQRNGVSISPVRTGDQWGTVGQDDSGHGAVLCVWHIYISARQTLDGCFPGAYPELRQDLSDGIAAMNGFIVANSLHPTSTAEVEASVAASDRDARLKWSETIQSLRPTKEQIQAACRNDEAGRMIIAMANQPREQRRQMIRDLLSVPRPPVMNPCM